MLTQTEANELIEMKKICKSEESYSFPQGGKSLKIPLLSEDGQERFLMDVSRGRMKILKCTYQERYEETIILLRLDINGPPHTNPYANPPPLDELMPFNGKRIQEPHLHRYVEGYSDRWAIPVPSDRFPDLSDLFATFDNFFDFCNVRKKPKITFGRELNEY